MGTNINRSISGIPTLGPGVYVGTWVGHTENNDGSVAVILGVENTDGHIEVTDLDISGFSPGDPIKFTIEMQPGPQAQLKGKNIRLVDSKGNPLTDYMSPTDIHSYLVENRIKPAGPKLVKITSLKR